MIKNIFIIIMTIIIGILCYFGYIYYIQEEQLQKTISFKEETIGKLEIKVSDLNKELSDEKSKNISLISKISDLESTIKSLEEKLSESNMNIIVSNFNQEPSSLNIKEDSIIKFVEMDSGEWLLNNDKKLYLMSLFKEETSIYEIIPIVDESLYKNDKDGLKQIGLSRQRAATAAGLLKSINSKNKVFISTEILTSKNERGFIIKKINL